MATVPRALATVALFALAATAHAQAASPVEEGFVTARDGARLFYRKVGSGPQVVITPGRIFLADDFARLAPGRTLVFYDTRNRGRSSRVADTTHLTIQWDVTDLEDVRRHFAVRRASLVGYSYMGLLVAMYAMDHPGVVERLVQLGPVPITFGTRYPRHLTAKDHPPVLDSALLRQIEADRRAGRDRTDSRGMCELTWRAERPWLVGDTANIAKLGAGLCDMPNEHPVNLFEHFRFAFTSVQRLRIPPERVRAIAAPVLTIHGTLDRNTDYAGGREWAMRLRDARLVTVPGAGHQSWVERPEVVIPAIDAFLRGGWPPLAERVTAIDPRTEPMPRSRSGRVRVPGGSLAYDVAGAGPPIVLVHGALVDRRLWDDQIRELARDHRVIRYDMRGFGESSRFDGEFSPVDDLHAVMTALGVRRAPVVGLSMGGMVATEYALEHPDRVSALVLVGAPLRGVQVPVDSAAYDLARIVREDSARGIRLLLDSAGMGAVDSLARARLRTMFAANLRGWAHTPPRLLRWPAVPAARRVGGMAIPTLVLVGTRDEPAILAFADSLAARIPGARRDKLIGAQHHPNVEQPQAFDAILRRFLAEVERR